MKCVSSLCLHACARACARVHERARARACVRVCVFVCLCLCAYDLSRIPSTESWGRARHLEFKTRTGQVRGFGTFGPQARHGGCFRPPPQREILVAWTRN
eukprot:15354283-Alexandrium_andersonii.AAC.1